MFQLHQRVAPTHLANKARLRFSVRRAMASYCDTIISALNLSGEESNLTNLLFLSIYTAASVKEEGK